MYGTVSPTRKFFASSDELRRFYVDQGHTIRWLSEHYRVSVRTVNNWLDAYGLRLTSEQLIERQKGRSSWNYRGYKMTQRGYVYVRRLGHPAANRDGYVMEHRLVMEAAIGRAVLPAEQIHHIDLSKANNRIENLMLFPSAAAHTEFHKYLERVAVHLLGITTDAPAPYRPRADIFCGGEWVSEIDLLKSVA